jgi:hypothetical protein
VLANLGDDGGEFVGGRELASQFFAVLVSELEYAF